MSFENMATRTITIDGDNWTHNPFPATEGVKVLKRLFKVFGHSFSVVIEAGELEGGIGKAVELLADNIDKDDVPQLIRLLAESTRKNGEKISYDNEFGGKYDLLFKVVKFVIMENYGSFFPKSATENE